MTPFEIQVLRECAGELPRSTWGPKVQAALQILQELKYVEPHTDRPLTARGWEFLYKELKDEKELELAHIVDWLRSGAQLDIGSRAPMLVPSLSSFQAHVVSGALADGTWTRVGMYYLKKDEDEG